MQKTKKEYLKLYLLQEAKIRDLTEMIKRNPNLKVTYNNKIKACRLLRKRIEEKINSVDDELLRDLLFEKYILGYTLEKISVNLNYSIRQIERIHKKALEKIEI